MQSLQDRLLTLMLSFSGENWKEISDEYLDDFVHHLAYRLAGWLHCFPRSQCDDSPSPGVRRHFADTALRHANAGNLACKSARDYRIDCIA